MNINYVGNFTSAMKSYTEEKIYKLVKKGIECDSVRVKLEKITAGFVVEISINNEIRASKKGEDFYSLVIDVVDKISSQYNRFKEYKQTHQISERTIESEDYGNLIEKEKIFIIQEMTDEEAIETMEVLGHQFFVYKDIDRSNNTCVVYKRNNETYGIIECR